MKFSFALVAALASVANAAVLNVARAAQDVFVPHIESPKLGDVLVVGDSLTVTWDTSNAPENITNTEGRVMLRQGPVTFPFYLARGFSILKGSVTFTVPDVVPSDQYQLVLFGDSGNFSPPFSIVSAAPAPEAVEAPAL
ncbi:hypothetical protein PC9H_006941 [Pleurotus ostreatus]|uniref:Yeast cell wall synthesis Kre9/Knh1-like N-terminal domain-containing protein n=1 Tax=Pleurotus ostreatus TaxID=5322 RepID=A0A8H7DRY9_PLEOS|nr:uncharacterized protein PC9H_006941 [Pleurotus ostreatus]KAF7431220.1 hypothetical protein PC9H_006941 [Pleurotus ostreatus]KAJ8695686.1 hypothetical protein PTI98_008259 [Pleurotus ostreatus]